MDEQNIKELSSDEEFLAFFNDTEQLENNLYKLLLHVGAVDIDNAITEAELIESYQSLYGKSLPFIVEGKALPDLYELFDYMPNFVDMKVDFNISAPLNTKYKFFLHPEAKF